MPQRQITLRYDDPLDLIWVGAAHRVGIKVERSAEVFAAWDGVETLTIGANETLDADDSLAQMIFHELCHSLVEGPEAFHQPDWGLDITDRSQRVHEMACLRLQAFLAEQFELRKFFASTTNFRWYYDALPCDCFARVKDSTEYPLNIGERDSFADEDLKAIRLAQTGLENLEIEPWNSALQNALQATSELKEIMMPIASAGSLWAT